MYVQNFRFSSFLSSSLLVSATTTLDNKSLDVPQSVSKRGRFRYKAAATGSLQHAETREKQRPSALLKLGPSLEVFRYEAQRTVDQRREVRGDLCLARRGRCCDLSPSSHFSSVLSIKPTVGSRVVFPLITSTTASGIKLKHRYVVDAILRNAGLTSPSRARVTCLQLQR